MFVKKISNIFDPFQHGGAELGFFRILDWLRNMSLLAIGVIRLDLHGLISQLLLGGRPEDDLEDFPYAKSDGFAKFDCQRRYPKVLAAVGCAQSRHDHAKNHAGSLW